MKCINKAMKLGLGSAVIGLAMVAAPAAEAFELTTSSGTYNLFVVEGSWNANASVLENTPWFDGDGTLANELATALDYDAFAIDQGYPTNDIFQSFQFGYDEFGGAISIFQKRNNGLVDGGRNNPSLNFFRYYVGGEEVVTAVPTPAAVLPTLFGLGLSAIRKREDKEQA